MRGQLERADLKASFSVEVEDKARKGEGAKAGAKATKVTTSPKTQDTRLWLAAVFDRKWPSRVAAAELSLVCAAAAALVARCNSRGGGSGVG